MATEAENFPYRQYIEETFNAHDLEAFDRYYTPNVLIHSRAPEIEPGIGTQHLKMLVGALIVAFPDMHVTVDDVLAQGDKLAARLRLEGTHLGPFAGLEPTGKKIRVIDLAMYQIENGRIAEVWSMLDTGDMRKQLAGA